MSHAICQIPHAARHENSGVIFLLSPVDVIVRGVFALCIRESQGRHCEMMCIARSAFTPSPPKKANRKRAGAGGMGVRRASAQGARKS